MQEREPRAGGSRCDGESAQLEHVAAADRERRSNVHVRVSSSGRDDQNVTGSDLSPRSVEDSRHSGVSAARLNLGMRRSSVPMAIWPSSRASGAPRQKWMPNPNAM